MKNAYEVIGDVAVIIIERKDGSIFHTKIDANDINKVNSFPNTWRIKHDKLTDLYYAQGNITNEGRTTSISLHRWLMNDPEGFEIDHINGDTLDNRRSCNLRRATKAENAQNRRGAQRNNISSGVRGVTWHKVARKWMVQVKVGSVKIYGGVHNDLNKAEKIAKCLRRTHMPFCNERI
ncbi:hypothetical protein B2I21_08560 [Chryseobacterium mucoviscidosis]|nr:hypothetical protein B2I21_08560 [Chryseobacterium mucoviscidosis]